MWKFHIKYNVEEEIKDGYVKDKKFWVCDVCRKHVKFLDEYFNGKIYFVVCSDNETCLNIAILQRN